MIRAYPFIYFYGLTIRYSHEKVPHDLKFDRNISKVLPKIILLRNQTQILINNLLLIELIN